jgi:hypothetical protein
MLFAKKIIRLIPFLGLVCFLTPTKAQINSPFSRYGLGNEVLNNQNVNSQAMGGFSAAYTPSMNSSFGQSININNPASYGYLYMTTFDLGINLTNSTLKSTTPVASYTSTYLVPNYLAIGVPINKEKKIGFAFGLRPLTQVNYSLNEFKVITSGDTIINNYTGQGGLNQAFFGLGKAWKYVSAGFNTGYNFGRKKIENIKTFQYNPDSTFFAQSLSSTNTVFGGVFLHLGVLSEFPIYSIKRPKLNERTEYSLSIGATATLDQTMSAQQDVVRNTGSYSSATQSPLDTALSTINTAGKIIIPSLYTGGIAFHKKEIGPRGGYDQWVVGLEYSSRAWKDKYLFYGQQDALSNSWMLRMGVQYCPNAYDYENFWSTVVYRAGFYTGKDYVNIDRNGLMVSAFTTGVSLPIRKYRSYDYQFSLLNLAMQFGQRGTGVNNYREGFFQLSVGYSLSDVWFSKRKYD